MALKKLCQKGLLIQRKTGRDLTSSIPRFDEILSKMLKWSDKPWLLFAGNIEVKNGMVIIDGQETNYSHSALQGALDFWQLRGGYVSFLTDDSLIAPWLSQWLDRLRNWRPEHLARNTQQKLAKDSEYPWYVTLATFPGIGSELALAIAKWTGSLPDSLFALSDRNTEFMRDKPKGLGKKRLARIREWFDNKIMIPEEQ